MVEKTDSRPGDCFDLKKFVDVVCPDCKFSGKPAFDAKCQRCGVELGVGTPSSLPSRKEEEEVIPMTCDTCGSGLNESQKFCTQCGDATVLAEQSSQCSFCSHSLSESESFCSRCGTSRGESVQVTPSVVEASDCPFCGSEIYEAACSGCGHSYLKRGYIEEEVANFYITLAILDEASNVKDLANHIVWGDQSQSVDLDTLRSTPPAWLPESLKEAWEHVVTENASPSYAVASRKFTDIVLESTRALAVEAPFVDDDPAEIVGEEFVDAREAL